MTFSRFAEHLTTIEATTKRLTMTDLLVELLKESSPDEIDKVVYLSLGQLAPLYASKEFGIAEKMMVRSLSATYDVSRLDVWKRFKNSGDLGVVAEKLAESGKRKAESGKTTVSRVFGDLLAIAEESGEGSQERKLEQTAALLRSMNPLGAKYVTRIILDKLRLGFSDKTVLDALSVLVSGDKSARGALEAAYNVRPDVGELARELRATRYELRAIRRMAPKLGTPILPALCQRLPSTEEIVEKMGEVAIEPKWDGQRIQAHVWCEAGNSKREVNQPQSTTRHVPQATCHVRLFTRSLEDVTDMFPDLVGALKHLIDVPLSLIPYPLSLILDGEIVGIDPKTGRTLPFQTMITRKRKYGVEAQLKSVPIRYMVFDVLFLNGKSLLNESFSERRALLEKLFNRLTVQPLNHALFLAPQVITNSPTTIRQFLHEQVSAGLEGIVAKKWDSPYVPGRTGFHWVKLKWEGGAKAGGLLDTIDCVVMGTYTGRGKRAGFGVGAFLVGVRGSSGNFQTVSKIGTGLSDEQWRELKDKGQGLKAKGQPKEYDVPKELIPDTWFQPSVVVEIQADNITKSPLHSAGFALRFPRLVRYRTDKKPEQATTVEEIKRLYRLQT